MKLSKMRQTLAEADIRLTKSLGQNFLHDANQLERILAAARLGRADRVLEIGPGLGPLTERLLSMAAEVLAIEKDRRLYELLQQRFLGVSHLRLVQGDALEFLRKHAVDWSDWKMVSNLPYSVASPILVELAQAPHPPRLMVATLQLEVAHRLNARAGDKDYGLLTLLVQLQFQPQGFFKIPTGCFFPEPEVDSACLTLERRPVPLLTPSERLTFVRVAKRSFSQRRKMMLKLLKAEWPAAVLEKAFQALSLPESVRAEAVGLEQFVKLSQVLHHAGKG